VTLVQALVAMLSLDSEKAHRCRRTPCSVLINRQEPTGAEPVFPDTGQKAHR